MDKWVHLNCALWSEEVYETVSGNKSSHYIQGYIYFAIYYGPGVEGEGVTVKKMLEYIRQEGEKNPFLVGETLNLPEG